MDAPLGAILLGLLALATIIFVLSAATMRTQTLLESRHHMKELEAQRALADKAEASRFTDLRQHLDTHLRQMHERDTIAATEFEKSRLETQREIRSQMEQMNRMLSARLSEFEHRLETRFERMGTGRMPATTTALPVHTPVHTPVPSDTHPGTVHEHAQAQQAREEARQAQMREEARLLEQRQDELRGERREERAADRPAESGWRRWF
jgi:hypothetical protein